MARRLSDTILCGLCGICSSICNCCFGQQSSDEEANPQNIALTPVVTAPAPAPAPAAAGTGMPNIPEEEEEEEQESSAQTQPLAAATPALAGTLPASLRRELPGFQTSAGPSTGGNAEKAEEIARSWKKTEEFPFQYGRLQAHGEQRRQWIADPAVVGCYIPRSTMTYAQFRNEQSFQFGPLRSNIDRDFAQQVRDLGLTNEFDTPLAAGQHSAYWEFQFSNDQIRWVGHTGQGVLVLTNIERPKGSTAPNLSAVSQAIYTRDFNIDTLKHVLVHQVVNKETIGFIKDRLYTKANNLTWPEQALQTWDHGTPEYDALLGSRIGKVVAYLVLGAFTRGTRYISRIVTWSAHMNPSMGRGSQMRFDIEVVPATE